VDTTGYLAGWSEDGTSAPGELGLRSPGWEAVEHSEGAYVARLVRASDGSIYAGEHEGTVFRSSDAGVTWSKAGSLPDGIHVNDMIQSSSFGHPFYVVSYDVVWKSFDACTTWFQTGAMPMKVDFLDAIMEAGNTIYVGGHIIDRPFHEGQVFKSTNWGVTWDTTAWPPIGFLTVRSLLQGIDGRIYAAGSEGGCMLRTTNGGLSWQGDFLVGPTFIYDLAQAADSTIYAGTDGGLAGHVWKSTDHGGTWHDLDSLPSLYGTTSLLTAADGSVYAGGAGQFAGNARIYRSTDGGSTWLETGDAWDTLGFVVDFVQMADGTILAGGGCQGTPYVWRLTKPYGWVTSSVFDAGELSAYGGMSWDFTAQGDSPVVKVRTDTLPDMSTAPDWDLCPPATNGDDISFLPSVHDGQRYVQYKIEMRGWDNFSTPVFHDISIEYTPTGVTEDWRRIGSSLPCLTASPNVFRKQVKLSFSVPESGHVEVRIFDIAGRPVRTVLDEVVPSGGHSGAWNGADNSGESVSAGVYFCTLRCSTGTGSRCVTKKVVYLGR
jgi:photosystem II stability/assembly factor-like uncharacterized protein